VLQTHPSKSFERRAVQGEQEAVRKLLVIIVRIVPLHPTLLLRVRHGQVAHQAKREQAKGEYYFVPV